MLSGNNGKSNGNYYLGLGGPEALRRALGTWGVWAGFGFAGGESAHSTGWLPCEDSRDFILHTGRPISGLHQGFVSPGHPKLTRFQDIVVSPCSFEL